MRRLVVVAVAAVMAMLLTACLGDSQFCATVKRHEETLNSFGTDRSDAAFSRYAEATAEISSVAPASVAAAWDRLDTVTRQVVEAHGEAGVRLEDMGDEEFVRSLDPSVLERLNGTYEQFNDTASTRETIVVELADECGVELEPADAEG